MSEPDLTAQALCHAVAALITEVCDQPYEGQAGREIAELDPKLSTTDVEDPAKFSHEVCVCYLRAAGDFIYGTGLVADRDDLLFSSASLARSACEYAALTWHLSDPDIAGTQRIALAMAAVRGDLNHPQHAGTYGVDGDGLIERMERWVARQSFKIPKGLDKAGPLQERMFPGIGNEQYRELSSRAHPRATVMLVGVSGMQTSPDEMRFAAWRDAVTAASRGLRAVERVAALRGGKLAHLADMIALQSWCARTLGLDAIALAPDLHTNGGT